MTGTAVARALPYRYLFGRLVREEWRLHANTFGGRRFAAFPGFVALVAAGTTTFFALGGANASLLLAGLHVVVSLLGLQVGTVGLVGRDAIEDLLGDTTLLIYTARTLPVSPDRLVVAFVLKDVLFYAFLFVLPLVVGTLPLVYFGAVALSRLPVLFLTAAGMFALGVGASLALVGLYTRSRPATLGLAGALVAGLALRGGTLLSVRPTSSGSSPPRSPSSGASGSRSRSSRSVPYCSGSTAAESRGPPPTASARSTAVSGGSTTRAHSRSRCSTSRAPPADSSNSCSPRDSSSPSSPFS